MILWIDGPFSSKEQPTLISLHHAFVNFDIVKCIIWKKTRFVLTTVNPFREYYRSWSFLQMTRWCLPLLFLYFIFDWFVYFLHLFGEGYEMFVASFVLYTVSWICHNASNRNSLSFAIEYLPFLHVVLHHL